MRYVSSRRERCHGSGARKWFHWWPSGIGVAILVLSLGLNAAIPARAAASELVQPGSLPSTDGTTVVWVDHGVHAAQFPNPQPILVASTPNMTYLFPDVSGDVVVWEQDCTIPNCPAVGTNIKAKNLVTGQQYDVANGYAPRISGTRVLYESGANLMLRDLATMAPSVVVATVPTGWDVVDPRISGNRIAWVESQVVKDISSARIKTALVGQAPVTVLDGLGVPYVGIDLAGDTLVYTGGPSWLTAVNLATGKVTGLPGRPYDQELTTNGRYVFWNRIDFGPAANPNGQRHDIVGYDLQTGSEFSVVQNAGWNELPATGGDLVAWMHGQPPDAEIHATSIGDVLPSTPRPNPGATSPDWLYFPQTHHYLSFGFKDFWLANGGLPVFGYPMTEEFSELNSDQGKLLTVQYTERQRFEYHPELAGTPYAVELGRLGAEDAAARHLTATAPFQPLAATTGSDANCTFFKETGHRVCFGFRAYWLAHGLDLGPASTAYQRSLALFGYPISEEFVDPQTGLVTQYFERVVFEYHPSNPAPYRVELRRLGANLIAARGW